jgi:membrane-bound serine protease (ClpP class)
MFTLKRFLLAVIVLPLLAFALIAPVFAQNSTVYVARLSNVVINPISSNYIERAIKEAEANNAQALVIEMDTPGGLSDSMDSIIKAIVGAKVPVIVYVYPPGGRAASAGVYITYAAPVAAMAPSTNIGSAHPVALSQNGSTQMDPTMEAKVTNDAVAKIRGLAERNGRNADWAEQAVRQSVNITADQAVAQHVVDLKANDLNDLLNKVDGRQVQTAAGTLTLQTKGAQTTNIDRTFIEDFLDVLSNPDIALILLSLGTLAIFFELSSPGAILPGVVGGIFLLLAFFALGMIPINYAGLLLIIFSFILFIADVLVTTHGILTIGGVAAFVLGSLILVNSNAAPFYTVSLPVIIAIAGCMVGFFGFAIRAVIKARFRKPATGKESMIGEIGEVRRDLDPRGVVFIEGELWEAVANDGMIRAGERVRVTSMNGLKLVVERAASTNTLEPVKSQREMDLREVNSISQQKGA